MDLSGRREQKTLRRRVSLSGVGVHSGEPVSIVLCPSGPDSGISFLRTGGLDRVGVNIPARSARVGSTELCTVLGDPSGASVATVEHLLSAFVGLGVDNAVVEIDGPEVPVLDGSAEPFVDAIDRAGLRRQNASRRFIRIRRPVRVELGEAYAEFRPHDGCRFEVAISFKCPVIGDQAFGIELTAKSFRKEIARARTFGYLKDVERLRASGLALGSSLDNSVAIGNGAVVNREGLRYPDEFVRHKLLDAIGDLALAGAPIQGLYRSYKGGHKLNALALDALLSQPDAWTMDHTPVPRAEPRGEFLSGILAPAFAPEFS